MSEITAYDVIGIIGTALIVFAYSATQFRWLEATGRTFPLLNLAGALLILVSLIFDWNLPSFLMEVFWVAISVYGLTRARAG